MELDVIEKNQRLIHCIEMTMGCLNPLSKNNDERLAWYRLLDAINGDEPRENLAKEDRA